MRVRLFAPLLSTALLLGQPAATRRVIVLIGPTGSGKATQTEFLHKRYGLPILAADDLVKENPAALAKYQTPGIDPVPPRENPALNDLVRDQVSRMDVSKGFVLDGYPATKDQADHLAALVREMRLPSPLIIQLDVPDQVNRKRARMRGRPDDTPEQIERRLKDYHREMDMMRAYYPEADIHTVDGARPVAEVSKSIAAILDGQPK